MGVELFTLLVLGAAVAVKFMTSRQTEALELAKAEVDNESRRLKSLHNQVLEVRREGEDRLRMFKHDRAELEGHLKEAEEELEERIERNEELEGD